MAWIGCVHYQKFRCDFMAGIFAWLFQFGPFCTEFRAVTIWYQMHPNITKCTKTCVYGPMVWIGYVRCEYHQHDFIERPFALIALYWPILDQLSCSNEMIASAPNRYETNKNMCLGSNGVYRVRSLRKFQTRLCGTNFCINCTSSTRFAPSFVQ